MFGHGLAIPVILDTDTSAAHLVSQWERNFHYGHLIMPPISLACCGMYAVAARQRYNIASDAGIPSWQAFSAAGIATAAIIPFTLAFMMKTNNILQKWDGEFKKKPEKTATGGDEVATFQQVRNLVASWGYMHCVRSAFPLCASFVGLVTLLREMRVA